MVLLDLPRRPNTSGQNVPTGDEPGAMKVQNPNQTTGTSSRLARKLTPTVENLDLTLIRIRNFG